MYRQNFRRGYHDRQTHGSRALATSIETGQRLTNAAWATTFDLLIDEYLEDGTVDNSDNQLHSFLNSYERSFSEDQVDLHAHYSDLGNEKKTHYFRQRAFHSLNCAMTPMWSALAHPELDFPKDILRDIQTSIALRALTLCRYRTNQMHQKGDNNFFDPSRLQFRKDFNGVVNEFDVALVLTDLVRRYPQLAVVPAPPKYESGSFPSRNADFLVIDRQKGIVHGVQAKVHEEPTHDYDPRYITLISGRADLGSTALKRVKENGEEAVVSYPGLIAANFICGLVVGQLPAYPRKVLLAKQHDAKAIMANHRAWDARILKATKDRVMHDLYKAAVDDEQHATAI